jgi:hypothetical protein
VTTDAIVGICARSARFVAPVSKPPKKRYLLTFPQICWATRRQPETCATHRFSHHQRSVLLFHDAALHSKKTVPTNPTSCHFEARHEEIAKTEADADWRKGRASGKAGVGVRYGDAERAGVAGSPAHAFDQATSAVRLSLGKDSLPPSASSGRTPRFPPLRATSRARCQVCSQRWQAQSSAGRS